MEIFNRLLSQVGDGKVLRVEVGLFWTAVLVERDGRQTCGLASTLGKPDHEHARQPAVRKAGSLESVSARQLAELVYSESTIEVSVGLATINALLPQQKMNRVLPAEEYIAQHGSHARVVIIGHFPFIESLRSKVQELNVLELNPREGDLPASAAPNVLPQADILAITSTSLINHTFDDIMRYRSQTARVMLLGPSTPLSPLLFDFGIHVLSGSIVERPEAVMSHVHQAANFRQLKSQGIQLVTLEKAEEGRSICSTSIEKNQSSFI